MNFPEAELVVRDIAGARALVVCGDVNIASKLIALGFVHDCQGMIRHIVNDEDRKKLVPDLIEIKAIFFVWYGLESC
ncbi:MULTISPECIES: hypothetical protein [unclassified Pseudomonas]|uniref:hypothetical protein n=1 Tax=unclassified Pseudomonas TaxID=196821 RepID=UPI002AC94DBE|nr:MULTISPECIES: hypothetical protein [unclassified Pseudomonas]MEB0047938.1 hypothetical protein [Pseudomonas sp. Dout3]MEB0098839.1 hypothetical protein [Pseudomonas sp. DC1.2]WPX59134.1 hypothetical protein RHM68_00270 [Pseudomonas sp. DC1.2]